MYNTDYKDVWEYVNQLVEFDKYVNSAIVNYKGEMYNLPHNMNTFSKMWGVVTSAEATVKIVEQRKVIT